MATATADLTMRNGVGVAAEAVLRPLDWRSSLRTRAATRRPLAGVASLTESLVVRCGDDAGLLLRVIQVNYSTTVCGTKPAACTVPASACRASASASAFLIAVHGLEYV
jgi:hypothetical protein